MKEIIVFTFIGVFILGCKNQKEISYKKPTLFEESVHNDSHIDSLFQFTSYPSYIRFKSSSNGNIPSETEVMEQMRFLDASGLPNEFLFNKWKVGKSKDSVINIYRSYKKSIQNHKWEQLFDQYAGFLLLGKSELLESFYRDENNYSNNYDIKQHLLDLVESGYENYPLIYSAIYVLKSKNKITKDEIKLLKVKVLETHSKILPKVASNSSDQEKRELNHFETEIVRIANKNMAFKELYYAKICNEY